LKLKTNLDIALGSLSYAKKLTDNWNNRGAKAITDYNYSKTKLFLSGLYSKFPDLAPPSQYPSWEGGCVLAFKDPSFTVILEGNYALAGFSRTETFDYREFNDYNLDEFIEIVTLEVTVSSEEQEKEMAQWRESQVTEAIAYGLIILGIIVLL